MKNVSDKCREIKTGIVGSKFFFFRKLCIFEIVKNYYTTDQATYDIIASWRHKAKNSHSEYIILVAFDWNRSSTNAPGFYVIRPLPVLFNGILRSI